MQPMSMDVREYHILRRQTSTNDGYSSETFKKSPRTYRFHFFPTADSMSRDSSGTVRDVRYKVVLNQSADIALGDRIGTNKEQFEVVSLLSIPRPPCHQMEVRAVWTST